MIGTLFAKEFKSCLPLVAIFAAILTVYVVAVTAMYDPDMSATLDQMMQAMPDLFAALGMSHAATTLLGFQLDYLYGFLLTLLTLLPLALILLLVQRLVARPIERGAMAFLLASPHGRIPIAGTMTSVLVVSLAVLMAYVTVLELATTMVMFPDDLDIAGLLMVDVGLCALWLLLAAICLLSACLFAGTAAASWAGGGLCLLEFVIQMVSQLGDDMKNARFLTLFTMFDGYGLSDGDAQAGGLAVLMAIVAAASAGVSLVVFSHRDLVL